MRVRLVVELEPAIKKKLSTFCAQNGTTIRHIVTTLLTNYLKDKKNGKTTTRGVLPKDVR